MTRVAWSCLQDDEECDVDEIRGDGAGETKAGKRTKMATVKGPWSKEEDDVVIRLVGQYGPKRWSLIASNLPGSEFCFDRSLALVSDSTWRPQAHLPSDVTKIPVQ